MGGKMKKPISVYARTRPEVQSRSFLKRGKFMI
jgi:hypothetical protein